MGLLDLFAGGGLKGLTSDMGSEGGLLSKFGMGKFPQQPGAGGLGGLGGLGQEGGLLEKLKKLSASNQQGSPPASDQGGQPQNYGQPQGDQPSGLAGLIMQYIQKLRT